MSFLWERPSGGACVFDHDFPYVVMIIEIAAQSTFIFKTAAFKLDCDQDWFSLNRYSADGHLFPQQ